MCAQKAYTKGRWQDSVVFAAIEEVSCMAHEGLQIVLFLAPPDSVEEYIRITDCLSGASAPAGCPGVRYHMS